MISNKLKEHALKNNPSNQQRRRLASEIYSCRPSRTLPRGHDNVFAPNDLGWTPYGDRAHLPTHLWKVALCHECNWPMLRRHRCEKKGGNVNQVISQQSERQTVREETRLPGESGQKKGTDFDQKARYMLPRPGIFSFVTLRICWFDIKLYYIYSAT